MRSRCQDPNNRAFKNYGGRGIEVAERWEKFDNFWADMGKRPSKKHTIERIDNNKHYDPSNCRWATSQEQARNRRTNRWIEYDGRKMILKDWAKELGISHAALAYRLKRLPLECALDSKHIRTRKSA
jgi:hypothetical protein